MPDISSLNTRQTILANQWKPSDLGFIAQEALPVFGVAEREFEYYDLDKGEAFSVVNRTQRADDGPAQKIDWSVSATTSKTVDHALRDFLNDSKAASKQFQVDFKTTTREFLQESLALAYEKRVADYLFDTATLFSGRTAALTGNDQFDDPESDPEDIIMTYKDEVMLPVNTLIMGKEVYDKLCVHAGLRDRLGNVAFRALGNDDLARIFKVDKVLVGAAQYNTANPAATASYSKLWGKYILLAHIRPGGAGMVPKSPSLGYTFAFNNLGGAGKPWRVREYHDESIGGGGTWIEVDQSVKELAVSTDCGYLLSTVVS